MNKMYNQHRRLTEERVSNIEETNRGFEVWRNGKIVICQSRKQAYEVIRPTIKHCKKTREKRVKYIWQDKSGQWYANTSVGVLECTTKNDAKRHVRVLGPVRVVKSEAVGSYGKGACNQTWENSQVRKLTRK
tara:strand:+ start:581 stop:976 length:396 start_codon:yes stop_codon:yes gene_type:complete